MEVQPPFHPVICRWFTGIFGSPTEVQNRAWSHISRGEHTLIAAPTGSGKTLAALLPCLDRIVRSKERPGDSGQNGVKAIYVTPLKALNNDIHHHMFRFAAEMSEMAKELGAEWPGFTVGVRTGDTSQSTRASMLRHPPDLLITTPESLYLMLTSPKAREILRTTEQVIVDEIHDLAADKRGVHLSLSLERLAALCGRNPQRIGVSATQKPLWRVARYLGGWEDPVLYGSAGSAAPFDALSDHEAEERELSARPVSIVESAMDKRFDVRVTLPGRGVRALDKEAVWTPLVERLFQLMEGARSVLVFVNNRRLCERLTLRLNDYAGFGIARSHHGSVSREKRLEVEAMLKSGGLRCLVATATLELGIDVGHVDLVVQIDSPKAAAAGIQRIGRAGHAVGGASRGVIAVRSRGDLAEAAVLARSIADRDIEEIRIPRWSLDVLAQHTVAAVASDDWSPGQLYRLFAQSDCFRAFPRQRYEAMLGVLSGLFPFVRPLIGWDRDAGRLFRLAATPMAASMGAGTIPQSSSFPVHHAETRLHIGELDEEFVHESRVGDVFQLGTSSWTIRSIRRDRVYVTESGSSLSEIPFWRAEAGGRSPELGRRLGSLLADIRSAGREPEASQAMRDRLNREFLLDEDAVSELMAYVRGQDAVCLVPTDRLIVAEHYKDDSNRHHLVIHSLFGRRINRTWEMALRVRFDALCHMSVYSAAKDDGIEFVFPEWDGAWFAELNRLTPEQVRRLLREALPGTSMFGRAFREIAETSLLLARGYERQSSWKVRHLSEALLKEALPYADRFPFLQEAYTSCLEVSLDVPGLLGLLQSLREGDIQLQTVDSLAPSPFAVRFMNDYALTALYESDALSKDVQLRLLNVSRSLAAEWFGPDGLRVLISPDALLEVRDSLERSVRTPMNERDPDASVLRLLKERGDLTEGEAADMCGTRVSGLLERLEAAGSVRRITIAKEERWICRDEEDWYARFPESPDAVGFILKRYTERRMSVRPEEIGRRYGMDAGSVRNLVDRWLDEGFLERAPFAEPDEEDLYTASKVAERIVQASLRDFRHKFEAVDPVRYAWRLLNVHRLLPSSRLSGPEGLLKAVIGLQGLYLPLSHWESILLPSRVADYKKEMLDRLCASGELFWMGRKEEGEKEGRIAFFLADHKALAAPYLRRAYSSCETSQPELLSLLERKGASFLSAIARDMGALPSELLPRLMELVWEGRVSNDQFAPLRTSSATKGTTAKASGFQSGLGRWYALAPDETEEEEAEAAALTYCKDWINRFGILTRGVSSLGSPYPWERLSDVLKRLEDWGMVTRGFFVRSIPAMQFSTPEQVELLQAPPAPAMEQSVLVSAADPANPFGSWIDWPEVPGAQFARKPGHFLVYDGGRWLLWVENYGKHIVVLPDAGPTIELSGYPGFLQNLLREIFRTLLTRFHLRKIVVERWNGAKAADSGCADYLLPIGGEEDRKGYVIWPSSLKGS